MYHIENGMIFHALFFKTIHSKTISSSEDSIRNKILDIFVSDVN